MTDDSADSNPWSGRFTESMDALVHELTRDRSGKRRTVYAAMGIGVAAVVATGVWFGVGDRDSVKACSAAQDRVDEVWNEARRDATRKHPAGAALGLASRSFSEVRS